VDIAGLPEFDWTFDLINTDSQRRRAAVERQAMLWDRYVEEQQRASAIYWQAGGTFAPADPAMSAQLRRAHNAMKHWSDQFAFAPVYQFMYGATPWQPLIAHAILFLRYEVLFPDEWGRRWNTKRHVLQMLGRRGPTVETHDEILELVDAAMRRQQRCEDGFYARVARTLDRATIGACIAAVDRDGDDNARHRAGYIRWAIDNPGAPVSLASWRRWMEHARIASGT